MSCHLGIIADEDEADEIEYLTGAEKTGEL